MDSGPEIMWPRTISGGTGLMLLALQLVILSRARAFWERREGRLQGRLRELTWLSIRFALDEAVLGMTYSLESNKPLKTASDVINLSLGGKIGSKFHQDAVTIATIGAFMNGIVSVVSAGNSGPLKSTLTKEAPWALLVGASSTDRKIVSVVKLGDGNELYGESAFQPSSFDSSVMYPIVYPGMFDKVKARYCIRGSLDDVHGKIVLCYRGKSSDVDKGKEVRRQGGVGMIILTPENEGYTTEVNAHWIPASHLSHVDSEKVLEYMKNANSSATATFEFKDAVIGFRPAPFVPHFSSRGPPRVNGGILKPDVVAPGLNILAAWHEQVGPEPKLSFKKKFHFQSGTSMAAPHVSGIAALVKQRHPSWPPSFVQSAIITSARNVDLDGRRISNEQHKTADLFTTGAGLVNASNALDPGLVYPLTTSDYISYVCGLGSYTSAQLSAIFQRRISCSSVEELRVWDLNYPSIMLTISKGTKSITVHRRVTNVGDASSNYKARVDEPKGLSVKLSTKELQFTEVNQEISFQLTFSVNSQGSKMKSETSVGQIDWVSDKYVVTSPIAITWI